MNQDDQSSTAFIIRQRRDSDIPAAADGLIKVHAVDGYPVEGVSQPESWLTPPGMITSWIAEQSGTVIGHVAISRADEEEAVSFWINLNQESKEKVAVLARLFVVPEARKKSVGERLMREAVDYANRRGLRLVLDVLTKDASAIRLYERMGWTQIGTAIHAYGAGQQAQALCFVSPPSD